MDNTSTAVAEGCTENTILSENHLAGAAKSIQAIDKASVHRICSGQVVLNLATAIKELVENSLDAGATAIEIRLKEYGSDLVEVSDNGSGVEEKNFAGLTLKHHTSKLKDFSDLVNVDTFGFRGEALSSLCALSNLTVTTCHIEASVGSRLEYDHHGHLCKQTRCARQPGTTVTLENLFSTLPVRHREFQRNLKKEFAKAVQVLTGYCVISRNVKITCTNQVASGRKNVVVGTAGNDNTKENIVNVFGSKQVQSLLEFKQFSPTAEVGEEYGLKEDQRATQLFEMTGYISTSEHGQGRSSTDRQFFFINNRPCDPQKISRLVNEVYHMYNRHQYPFVLLNISLAKDNVDVNVTPDKRQIFVQEEKLLLATIKTSLIKLFEPKSSLLSFGRVDNHFKSGSLAGSPHSKSPLKSQSSCPEFSPKPSLTATLANLKRSFSSAFSTETSTQGQRKSPEKPKQRRLDSFIASKSSSVHSSSPSPSISGTDTSEEKPVSPFVTVKTPSLPSDSQTSEVGSESASFQTPDTPCVVPGDAVSSLVTHRLSVTQDSSPGATVPSRTNAADWSPGEDSVVPGSPEHRQEHGSAASKETIIVSPGSLPNTGSCLETDSRAAESSDDKDTRIVFQEIDEECQEHPPVREVTVPFSLTRLKERLAHCKRKTNDRVSRGFRAKITPGDNDSAENELKKEISKDMFARMEILGQFNLGFIIAKLERDLFIIDQHATDEKYNFEQLQQHTVIQSQKLIQPQPLELTAANETILLDNLDIFLKNGFEFITDEEALPGQRVKLVSKPLSKNWIFGKEDIEELIFMLSDSPGIMCRPTRIRQMFASRACRKSVMIGTALNKAEMTKLVTHMGQIEQPWNCPHGRPTMRHLINLDMLPD